MNLAEKIVTGSLAVVALGLLLTNPNGDTALGNAITNTLTGWIKALQFR